MYVGNLFFLKYLKCLLVKNNFEFYLTFHTNWHKKFNAVKSDLHNKKKWWTRLKQYNEVAVKPAKTESVSSLKSCLREKKFYSSGKKERKCILMYF